MGIIRNFGANFKAAASILMNMPVRNEIGIRGHFHFECFDKNGGLRWEEKVNNILVNVGLDDILDKWLKGSGYTASMFVGLKDTGTAIAADTMASHGSWTTITPYSDGTDPALVLGSVSSQSVDNAASKATFNINATDEVFGAFVKTDNTKGGTAGTLISVVDFGSSRNVVNGDTLNVTATYTSASV